MNKTEINKGLCRFIQASPTPFHAAAQLAAALEDAGYQRLHEADSWQLISGQGYYLTRNDSSLIAFHLGTDDLFTNGFSMMGAHTDSPCLKLKPNAIIRRHGYVQLGVEVYGGVLMNPWFDRDLSIAGRVNFLGNDGRVDSCLIDMERAVATIPSLAIHLDREVNNSRNINAQNHLPPVFLQSQDGDVPDFHALLLKCINDRDPKVEAVKVLDYELSLYDVQPPAVIGFNNDFIASARLDNLLSCYVGLQSLLVADRSRHTLLVCTDHEEVGSTSAAGAAGPFLEAVLERIVGHLAPERFQESMRRMLSRSMLVSIDNAHGIHPNYPDKHDSLHSPVLNNGPVVKVNANQRYASNSETIAWFRALCQPEDTMEQVPLQNFVMRSDLACGSTIGPIIAAELGVRTLDIGVPTFGMHSIRELAGSTDAMHLYTALTRFLNKPRP